MSALEDPRWTALSKRRRDELLDGWRNIEVDGDDWYKDIYVQFKEKCSALGIDVNCINFSGFSCQGDGACFTGSVDDWPKLLAATGNMRFDQFRQDWSMLIRSVGRYCHSGTMLLSSVMHLGDNPFDPDEDILQHDAWNLGYPFDADVDVLEDDLLKFFRDLADQLYKDLEAEYDHLTSDETVVSFILDYDEGRLVEPESFAL